MRRHFSAVGLPTGLAGIGAAGWTADRLVAHMAKDKKAKNGRITFILARGIGRAFIAPDVEIGAVTAMLADAIAA